MKTFKFFLMFFVVSLWVILPSCSHNEPSNAMEVTKVGLSYQDTQGLIYLTSGNGVIVQGYQYSPKTITIPANIKYQGETIPVIGFDAYEFIYCESIDSFRVSSNNQYLADIDGVLYDKEITKLIKYPRIRNGNKYVVPSTVKTIGKYAFYGNQKLKSVDLSSSVEKVETEAFWGCNYISEIKNTQSINEVDTACFGYTLISEIELPKIRKVGMRAFLGCDNITKVHLGAGLTSIYDDCLCIENSMIGCIYQLESYTIEAVNPPTVLQGELGSSRYREEYEPTLYVPSGSVERYKEVMATYFSKIEPIQ